MNEVTRKPRELKLYAVRNADGESVYVKAKSKTEAVSFVVTNAYTVALIGPKDMETWATDIANGVQIHTA